MGGVARSAAVGPSVHDNPPPGLTALSPLEGDLVAIFSLHSTMPSGAW